MNGVCPKNNGSEKQETLVLLGTSGNPPVFSGWVVHKLMTEEAINHLMILHTFQGFEHGEED